MSRIFEEILEKRGVNQAFLMPKYEDLGDPMILPDMALTIKRIVQAKNRGEKVMVYGDYDVDGVTATTIMSEALNLVGITEVETMLPDRFIDGYGMSERAVERAVKTGVKLVVTVDCGSNNSEVISELKAAGIDVIVTDHHELSGEVPEGALACVNPKRPDKRTEMGSLEDLAGAGVAFMVAKALTEAGKIPDGQEKWLLDLAMIGTICDSMTMSRDNRIICKYGMIVLEKTRREGLKALMKVARVKTVNTEAIGFQIGPRLNAAGRMETAEIALKLLRTKSKSEAVALAMELDKLNSARQKQQKQAAKEVEQRGIGEDPVLVVTGDWHEGILGIIAGRLEERYRRPTFVLSEVDGNYKGSGRSFGDFNLALALKECQDCLLAGGGHAAACGLKVKHDKIEDFKREVNEYYRSLGLVGQEKYLEAAEDVRTEAMEELSLGLMEEMRGLEPFGNGNEEPIFCVANVLLLDIQKMGEEGNHLRLMVRDNQGKVMKMVAFFAREEWFRLEKGADVNIWMSLMENEWNGTRSVEGRILRVEYAE